MTTSLLKSEHNVLDVSTLNKNVHLPESTISSSLFIYQKGKSLISQTSEKNAIPNELGVNSLTCPYHSIFSAAIKLNPLFSMIVL